MSSCTCYTYVASIVEHSYTVRLKYLKLSSDFTRKRDAWHCVTDQTDWQLTPHLKMYKYVPKDGFTCSVKIFYININWCYKFSLYIQDYLWQFTTSRFCVVNLFNILCYYILFPNWFIATLNNSINMYDLNFSNQYCSWIGLQVYMLIINVKRIRFLFTYSI